MFKLLLFTTLVVTFVASENFLSQEYIDQINREATTWTAGKNFDEKTPLESLKSRLGAKIEIKQKKRTSNVDDSEDGYPKSFDARDKWGDMCPSVKQIRDQSDCGSCWAFGAAEAITDRTCIATDGKFQKTLSATDLLACCDFCGDGCVSGIPIKAWIYWYNVGLPTGGEYGDKTSCKPYPFPKCEHTSEGKKGKYPPCNPDPYDTPVCKRECQAGYPIPYEKDLHKGRSPFNVDIQDFKKELMYHGPFEVAFTVFSDWFNYKSGVYQPTPSAQPVGGHAVRIVGWGVENGTKYWTIMNSWNEDWGFNGTFKILRGDDTCGIESQGVAGYPDV